ncbi:MAG TPA: DUF885 family protein [Thermoplasmata archaeon]|nr:DUF885 family protein [Thermoplasmata archaeon]
MPLARIDKIVLSIVLAADSLWKRYQPTASTLQGAPVWDSAEDLTSRGLEAWRAEVVKLRDATTRAARGSLSVPGRTVLAEVRRFASEQILKHKIQRLYDSRADVYLNLCAFSLLPFYLRSRFSVLPDDMSVALESRLRVCIRWLDWGEKRVKAGMLEVTDRDRTTSERLLAGLSQWRGLPEPLCSEVIGRLERWREFPLRNLGRNATSVSLVWYLKEVLGLGMTPDRLFKSLALRLRVEVGRLLKWGVPTSYSGGLDGGSPIDSVVDPRLDMIKVAEATLKESVRERFLAKTGPRALFLSAPLFAESFIPECLYLPPTSMGFSFDAPGLVVLPRTMWPKERQTEHRARMTVTVAHEVCPGHDEQLRRAAESPFSPLYSFTKSPVGFEGWGFYAESAVLSMSEKNEAAGSVAISHRVRRLTAGLWQLAGALGGLSRLKSTIDRILIPLPLEERERLSIFLERNSGQLSRLLPYCIGILQTEEVLRQVGRTRGINPHGAAAHEAYLKFGPILPENALPLIQNGNV